MIQNDILTMLIMLTTKLCIHARSYYLDMYYPCVWYMVSLARLYLTLAWLLIKQLEYGRTRWRIHTRILWVLILFRMFVPVCVWTIVLVALTSATGLKEMSILAMDLGMHDTSLSGSAGSRETSGHNIKSTV